MVDSSSDGAPTNAPRRDLTDTEGCGGGIRFSWSLLMFLGYMGICRRKKYVGGRSRGPRGWGVRPPLGGVPGTLVAASSVALRPLQVPWITFVPKITLQEVSFHLDSV